MTNVSYSYRLVPATATVSEEPQPEVREKSATILVVEDDVHLMEGIREILELDNYRVVTAPSGVDGLEMLRTLPKLPDLIVSDIMMPKMDGYQFFEAVRLEDDWLAIPFIFLTAKGEKADIRLGKALGADDYVTKPFSAEDLLVAVSSKLARKQQLQSALSSQVNDMKRRILTILNHEFRTPLTYVVAYADMLNRDADDLTLVELREFLKGVNSGADRLRRLIENFILLVELETGEIELTYSWRKRTIRNYQRLVDLSLKQEQEVIAAYKHALKVNIAPETPLLVGDEEYLSAALARLVDNACKFSDSGSIIKLDICPDEDGNPSIRIEDFGRGIPNHEIDQIFDVFYQVNRQKFEDQGAGSGLAIVRGIAQIHGAEIRVQSEDGKGSTFSLHFPSAHEEG